MLIWSYTHIIYIYNRILTLYTYMIIYSHYIHIWSYTHVIYIYDHLWLLYTSCTVDNMDLKLSVLNTTLRLLCDAAVINTANFPVRRFDFDVFTQRTFRIYTTALNCCYSWHSNIDSSGTWRNVLGLQDASQYVTLCVLVWKGTI
jgi:hypothetical protein